MITFLTIGAIIISLLINFNYFLTLEDKNSEFMFKTSTNIHGYYDLSYSFYNKDLQDPNISVTIRTTDWVLRDFYDANLKDFRNLHEFNKVLDGLQHHKEVEIIRYYSEPHNYVR